MPIVATVRPRAPESFKSTKPVHRALRSPCSFCLYRSSSLMAPNAVASSGYPNAEIYVRKEWLCPRRPPIMSTGSRPADGQPGRCKCAAAALFRSHCSAANGGIQQV
jgi:hypothetical protein